MIKTPFNRPYISGSEKQLVEKAIERGEFCGDNYFTKKCESQLKNITGAENVLLTSSCTHAIEMIALLLEIVPGDEIIMSSYNFVSAANAFVLRGAKIVFVDILEEDLNIDPNKIETAITSKTRAILTTHYGGISCRLDKIHALCKKHDLFLIEDAAHCIDSYHNRSHLGTIGDFGVLSFHSTKNIHCGEGGALLINTPSYSDKAEIIREKGTNRKQFLTGRRDKYEWVNIGSSYLMSELQAAFLFAQLKNIKEVTSKRHQIFSKYYEGILLEKQLKSPYLPDSNFHIFYILVEERQRFIAFMKQNGVQCSFHYVPLHSSIYGIQCSSFHGQDKYTTSLSNQIVRLPLYYSLENSEYIVELVNHYFEKNN